MDFELENLMLLLNENIPTIYEDPINRAIHSKEIVGNIKEALSTCSIIDSSHAVTFLLDRDKGLTNFLLKVERSQESMFGDTLRVILEILELVLIKFSDKCYDLLHLIKDSIMKFIQAKEASLRKLAYKVLIQIVESASHNVNNVDFDKLKLQALLNQMFVSLGQSSFENASSVKKQFFILIGRIAKHFPSVMKEKASRILKFILHQLEKEVKISSEKMEHTLVIGYVEALSGLFSGFHNNDIIVSSGELQKVHNLLLEIVSRGLSGRKRDSSRAALTAALTHSDILKKWFMGSYKKWFECLKSYALHKNPEDSKIGTKMFSKFMGEISHELCSGASDFSEKAIVVEFFVRNMIEILESTEATTKLKMLAVKALGQLSRSVSTTNAMLIFDYISKKAVFLCLQEDVPKNVLAIYPVCLESIGMFLAQHGSALGNEQLSQLQKICIQIFSRYLDIAEKKQYLCGRAIVVFLLGMRSSMDNPIGFSKLVRDIITQGLIRSSRPELGTDDLKKYSSFWSDFMNFSRHVNLPLTLETHLSVTGDLDQQLIASLSSIIKRLNFEIEGTEKSLEIEDTDNQLNPKNLNDWQLLENLVDLFTDIAKSIEPKERLVALLISLGEEVIAVSLQHPHVLGFYRLLALVLQIVEDKMPTSEQGSYKEFIKNLISRLPQLSNESLMSSVQAILSSPAWLVNGIRDQIISALISAIKVGLTNPKLAAWPLNALELWQDSLNPSDFDHIMGEVAPHLELFLHTVEQHDKDLFIIRGSRMKNNTALDLETWNQTQRQVMKLLGAVGPSCGRIAVRNEDEILSKLATEWQGDGSQLNLKLPLNDIEASISIETFLPHVLHLVYHSSDMKIRMAACEFLHGACVLLIGTTSHQSEDYKSRHPSTHLYSKLFPAILELAVDTDGTVRVLFENLLAQIVHWFSRPSVYSKDSTGRKTILGTETGLLVEVLMESVCSDSETSLVRDAACNSIREFLDWIIKQSPDSVLWENAAAPDFLFQKLRALATHPSAKQRLGAAIICNNIYRSLRSCEPLMSLFTLDLLAHFLVSLSMADKDGAEVGTQEQCELAVCNLGRIVYSNKNMFSTPHPERRTAPLLVTGTISELNEILMGHVFSEHLRTRRLCLKICRALLRPASIASYAKNFLDINRLETFLSSASLKTILDVCRMLLHHGVIDVQECKKIALSDKKYDVFLQSLSTSLEDSTSCNGEIATVALTWLELVTECSSKVKDLDLLPVELVVRSLLQPCSLGFPPKNLKSRHDFYGCFQKLLPLLTEHRQVVLSTLSRMSFDVNAMDFNDAATLDSLYGLNMLASFALLDLSTLKLNNPAPLLKLAIDPLIAKCKVGECAKQIKASCWLIDIAIHFGLGMDLLAAELKDPSMISGTPFLKGQYIRGKLGHSLWKTVLERPRNILSFCPELGNGDPQQWDLLKELLLAALNLRKFWITDKLLESWQVLLEHAKSYSQMCHLRSLVDTMLRLDLHRVGASSSVKRWIMDSWNDTSADVNFAKESAQLLRIFSVDCSATEESEVVGILDNFFSRHFPSKTTDLRTDSEKSDYFSVFNLLLDVANSPPVCHFLVGVFSLEPQHPRAASFTLWMNSWMKETPLTVVCRLFEKLRQKATLLTVPGAVRVQAVEGLYVPLLSACPISALHAHLGTTLEEFVQVSKESFLTTETIIRRTVLCNVLSIFVTRAGFQQLTNKHNASYCTLEKIPPSADGKNLLRSITKFALDIRKLTAPPLGVETELFQKLHGSSFKLIQSIASVSALDETAVDKLVFKPLTPVLWNAIVGTTKEYALKAEVERGKKQFLVHLPTPSGDTESNVGYAPSQYLYASSLSEDVHRFDFNEASVTSQSTYVSARASASTTSAVPEENLTSFNLTLNELNQHSCMAPLLAFLREQGDKALDSNRGTREPAWMVTLRDTLANPSVHRNVVLFIVRLVLNLEPLFRAFAKSWYTPLLVSLLRRLGGEPLNSLFRDGLDMVLDWCKEVPPDHDDKEFVKLASAVVEFVAKHITGGGTEVIKDNKEMFRAILNVWQSFPLVIPHALLEEMLGSSRSTQLIGLVLVDAIISHGFLRETDEWVPRLKSRLVELLSEDEKRDVLRTTAFVCGSILARRLDEQFEARIVEELNRFYTKGKPDVFTDALFEITRHHAHILRLARLPYLNLNLLPRLHGTLKARCLEILSVSWLHMEDPWKEIGRSTFQDILKSPNPAFLGPTLRLLTHLIPRLELEEWIPLWGRLSRLAQHENVECRSKLYELVRKAFDSAPKRAEFAQALLRACTDRNQELAIEVQNFLSEKLPNTTVDRILSYLKTFYSTGSEDNFLPYFSFFLLERATKSPRYREPVFEHPLADVPFEVLDLSSLSSQKGTQSFRGTGGFLFPSTLRAGFLRATQQTTYQTFGTVQGSANWLMSETQSEGQLDSSRLQQSPTKSTSSLAIPTSPGKAWKRFADPSSTPPSPEKRRSYYINKRKAETNVANQPTIYRRYRTGELPDVQIPLSALLAPLQALALSDPLIAKTLFCSLLIAVREKVKEITGSNHDFAASLNESLKEILIDAEKHGSSSNVISAIFEYLWMSTSRLDIEADKIYSAAKKHHCRQLGILVLESLLATEKTFHGPQQSKKLKMTNVSTHSPSDWFLVAESYADLADMDSARAVIIHLTDCEESTVRAIECEMAFDWERAFSYYSRSLSSESVTEREATFCQEYQLKCMEYLGEWDEIRHLQLDVEPWNTRSLLRDALETSVAEAPKHIEVPSLTAVIAALYPELAALEIKLGKKERAAYYVNKATEDFFTRYSLLSQLDFSGRRTLLERVCLVTEVQKFLGDSSRVKTFSLPKLGDSTLVWDTILALRRCLACCSESEVLPDHLNTLPLELAAVAIEQRNFFYAQKLIEKMNNVPPQIVARQNLLLGEIFAMQQLRRQDPGKKLGGLIRAKTSIQQASCIERVQDQVDLEKLESKLCFTLARLGQEAPNVLESKRCQVEELWNSPINEMVLKGLNHAKRRAEICEKDSSTSDAGHAYYSLASYLHEWRSSIPVDQFHKEFTIAVMKSMKLGSKDGASLFPLVILMAKDDSEVREAFIKERAGVPLSTFLPFMNQLVSHCSATSVFESLLLDMAKEYPTNVRLPLQISRPNFELHGQHAIACRIESLLADDLALKMFLKSIDYLRPPEIIALEVVRRASGNVGFEEFKAKYLNLAPPNENSLHGRVHFKFSETFSVKFEKAYREGRLSEIEGALQRIKTTPRSDVAYSLRDYSPWMANYRFGEGRSGKLFLPVSKGKMLRVESFRDDIRFIISKQFPVKLTLIIDGAKELLVLIKHGEDVRQDERIIQLLDLIDVALVRDEECRKRSLRIHTFQVVPLSVTCGMFEWVEGTVTLKKFLESDPKFRISSARLAEEHAKLFTGKGSEYYERAPQEKLIADFQKMASLTYPYGLSGGLKHLSQSAEAYFYLRQRLACSHGTQCSALWILGVGDRHLSNSLVSVRTGNIIPIDYGMAFGTGISVLPIPELAPCRLTTQFQQLIPGLGIHGPIRESMVHALRVARNQMETLLAALAVFVSEPTVDWLKKSAKKSLLKEKIDKRDVAKSIPWSPAEVIERTENILKGTHPASITIKDLQRNPTYTSHKNRDALEMMTSILWGNQARSLSNANSSAKRKLDESNNQPAALQDLTVEQQVDILIRQSINESILSRMYYGWEPWI